jgi:hypothetical protein
MFSIEDRATLQRLGMAIGMMCVGALGLVAAAITLGNMFG